ncbi:MAG TPA: acyltransferase [Candidatus Acidoferrales bacterium]|nr:acyltransferase [Candidatus Acidoferrales bacterium]
MASVTAPSVSPAPASIQREPIPRPTHNLALGYLRAFLVILVLAHHSVIAYLDSPPPLPKSLDDLPRIWRAFPIVDQHAHWTGFGLFVGFNDDFFMSLMFFVSGLFVWSSLRRKGTGTFVRDRMIRLGIPFLVAALVVAPIAYYPTYIQMGGHGVSGYIRQWMAFGDWPTGPAWFVWLLLAFDLGAAAIFAIAPNFGASVGRLSSNAREHPVRLFLMLIAVSAAVFAPMSVAFGPMNWTSVGPFQFQTARLFHYLVYFVAGIGVGAYGIDRGLLAPDGVLARHWGRWVALALTVFFLSVAFVLMAITGHSGMSPSMISGVGGCIFAITCGAESFAFLALFIRFATRRRWTYDSLSDNEYGMYLIHYAFVSWLQLALLAVPLAAIEKGTIVFVGVLLLSWGASAAIRSIPGVARVV